jgi:serine/threonine protein kinase
MLGQVLGHYRILEKIGAGGMGEVYRARDDFLKRDVAIKTLHSGLLNDPRAKEKLLQEARSSSSLNDPHICTIYEVGESDGKAFIAMELVEGRPLSSLIPPEGLPVKLVVRYGKQIAAALAHAHDHGIIHRDVKSSNVVITPSGLLKVLDFGLALHLRGSDLEDITRTQDSAAPLDSLAGTLPYMAPEVLRGCEATERADIWALGVVLYEMATGNRPFQARTANELVSAILRDAPLPVRSTAPGVLKRIIERCLEKEAGHRYQRASEVCATLAAVASDDVPVPLATDGTTAPSRTRIAWLVGSVAILCLAGLLALNVGGLRRRIFGPGPSSQIQSLAVLPLENLSRDPNQEYFADGMTDALGHYVPTQRWYLCKYRAKCEE